MTCITVGRWRHLCIHGIVLDNSGMCVQRSLVIMSVTCNRNVAKERDYKRCLFKPFLQFISKIMNYPVDLILAVCLVLCSATERDEYIASSKSECVRDYIFVLHLFS